MGLRNWVRWCATRNWGEIGRGWFAASVLLGVVAYVFWPHLTGRLTFPWDFQGGYHAHAVARLRGGLLDSPQWYPWGGFGFPAFLSMQDGGWYLPLYVFKWLDLPYDLINATRLQVLHVWAAGIGMFLLLRNLRLAWSISLLGGLCYLFSATFFSNAEHVDIVRGAALLPWLFLALGMLKTRGGGLSIVFAGLTFNQFLMAAYPGMVVSAAYAALGWFAIAYKSEHDTVARKRYIIATMTAGASALLISMVKFLPVFADLEDVRTTIPGHGNNVPLGLLPTLLYRYDVAGLPNGTTMQSLYLPAAALVLAAFCRTRSEHAKLGFWMILISVVFLIDNDRIVSWVAHLPGAKLSRFHIADFRPVVHLGLILLAADGLEHLRGSETPTPAIAKRLLVLALAISMLAIYALATCYRWTQVRHEYLGALLICAFVYVAARFLRQRKHGISVLAAALSAITAAGALSFYRTQPAVWRTERSDAYEIAQYGDTIRHLILKSQERPLRWQARPPRFIVGSVPTTHMGLFDYRYNRAWYGAGFAAFGYEDLKGSETFASIYALGISNQHASLRDWLVAGSRFFLARRTAALTEKDLGDCLSSAALCGFGRREYARMLLFAPDGATASIHLDAPGVLIENESWYPGWHATLCEDGSCTRTVRARPLWGMLRAWDLPAGTYRLVTEYNAPLWGMARLLAILGLALMVLAAAVAEIKVRRVRSA